MLTEPVVLVAIIVVLLALTLALVPFIYCKTRKRALYTSDAKRPEEGSSGPVKTPGKVEIGKRPEGRSRRGAQIAVDDSSQVHPNPRCFTLKEVREFTDNFSDANQLGKGGFGPVYRGVITTTKEEVAVKRLTKTSEQGDNEFRTEVEKLGRAHHKHVVSLVGYCKAPSERILVYELVLNGSLYLHLHEKRRPTLAWSNRLKIALGSAKGLAYLHEGCTPKIVHRDIKATNILVDSRFEAKIADFGLAKFISESKTHVSTVVKGTRGYFAPEYISTGKLTEKSDIFSFGVVLLELITGRKPQSPEENSMGLVAWARPQLKQALEGRNFDSLVDPKLQKNYGVDEMARMMACAAACVCESAEHRPKMSKVVRALEGELPLSDLNDGIRPEPSIPTVSGEGLTTAPTKTSMALASQQYGMSPYSEPTRGSSSKGPSRRQTC